nr:uncharacterized protein LOC109166029 [Ipomoea batatas]
MDDLTVKESRILLELAKQCSEVPWKLPEAAANELAQSAEPRTSIAQHVVPAAATSEVTAPTSAASQSASQAAAVTNAAPVVQNVISTAASSNLMLIAPPGSSNLSNFEFTNCAASIDNPVVQFPKPATSIIRLSNVSCSNSQADASKISSPKIGVPPVHLYDKQVHSDILAFSSVYDVIKTQYVSLVVKLPTSDLSLDSLRVSIPDNNSVKNVFVPLSTPVQCIQNPVASRTRKGKAKLANRVIPVAPSIKRKLIMDNASDDEPPLKSQKSVSTRQSRGKVSVPPSLPKSSSSSLPLPVLLHKELKDAWIINKDRTLLLQQDIDVENFTACCSLIDLLRSQNLLQTVTNVVINDYYDRSEVDIRFTPDFDLIASTLSNSHNLTWPKRNAKKPGKPGDLESSFLPSSFAILLRLATTNWQPTVTVHIVSKKMVVLLFKIRNNIQFYLGELIFHHIMGFRHRQGKEDKVLLPFSSLIYGILCKQGFQKHRQEEELFITSKYTIDKLLFLKSHFDDYSALKFVAVSKGESALSNLPCVSLNFAVVRARVLSTHSILTGLKSTVVQMEKVLLEDKKLLQSFEADDVDPDSAPTR